ncbi:uncharacterized protein PV09_04277 [Verruconis gallopava]|uniref:Uncharacterized protein n=1 Tax=Verruconis gallopava TaxID=253628 RepID=A0A0D1YV64_9PEZI|nr:uncharacterized protein PV09_04277 [Verruconis gallopava]KIW04522.1 hypothetical protein PV09_04277 [Verruconis gallopava]
MASGNDLKTVDADLRREQLYSEIGSLVRQQDRVLMLQVEAQIKREALKHLRSSVADEYSKISGHLRESRIQDRLPDSVLLALYQDKLESARNELGPAEEEFSALEFRLVKEEGILKRKGEKIRTLWQSFPVSEADYPMDISFADCEDEGSQEVVLTEFSFASSTAEEQHSSRPCLSHPEPIVDATGRPPDISLPYFDPPPYTQDLNATPNSVRATQSPRIAGLTLATPPTPSRKSEDTKFRRRLAETEPDHELPELFGMFLSSTETDPPELYVDIINDLPELAKSETNAVKHLEPILIDQMPLRISTVLHHFDKFTGTGEAFKRWMLHQVRKSPLDMIQYQSYDETTLIATVKLSDPDFEGWVHVQTKPPPSMTHQEVYQPNLPPEVQTPKLFLNIWW